MSSVFDPFLALEPSTVSALIHPSQRLDSEGGQDGASTSNRLMGMEEGEELRRGKEEWAYQCTNKADQEEEGDRSRSADKGYGNNRGDSDSSECESRSLDDGSSDDNDDDDDGDDGYGGGDGAVDVGQGDGFIGRSGGGAPQSSRKSFPRHSKRLPTPFSLPSSPPKASSSKKATSSSQLAVPKGSGWTSKRTTKSSDPFDQPMKMTSRPRAKHSKANSSSLKAPKQRRSTFPASELCKTPKSGTRGGRAGGKTYAISSSRSAGPAATQSPRDLAMAKDNASSYPPVQTLTSFSEHRVKEVVRKEKKRERTLKKKVPGIKFNQLDIVKRRNQKQGTLQDML